MRRNCRILLRARSTIYEDKYKSILESSSLQAVTLTMTLRTRRVVVRWRKADAEMAKPWLCSCLTTSEWTLPPTQCFSLAESSRLKASRSLALGGNSTAIKLRVHRVDYTYILLARQTRNAMSDATASNRDVEVLFSPTGESGHLGLLREYLWSLRVVM